MTSRDQLSDGDLVAAVRTQLADEEAEMQVPQGDVGSIVRDGRRRQRATVAGAGLAIAAVVVGGVAILGDTGQPSSSIDVVGSATDDDTGPADSATEDLTDPPSAATADVTDPPSAATVLTPLAGTGPELVITTPDGVVRWRDGATVEVPGLGADVEAAFPDGEGGIVFSRGGRIARMMPDGSVTFLTDPIEGQEQPPPGDLDRLVDVRLEDVDPISGTVAVLSVRDLDEASESAASQLRLLDLDGRLLEQWPVMEWTRRGIVALEVSVGGDRFITYTDLGGGSGHYGLLSPVLSWSPSSPPQLVGAEVDHDGASVVSLGVAPDGRVSLVRRDGDLVAAEATGEWPLGPLLDPLGITPVDVTSLSGQLVVLTVEQGDGTRTPALVDLVTAQVTLVDVEGTARLAPLDTP